MIGLQELKALNNRPPRKVDNFNRECSFVASRGGFVIHSAVHRSTAYIHPDIDRDAYFVAQYWLTAGPVERDEFITQIVGGAALVNVEERAFRASRPDWHVKAPRAKGSQGNRHLTAVKAGPLETRVAAYTWRHLHARTK